MRTPPSPPPPGSSGPSEEDLDANDPERESEDSGGEEVASYHPTAKDKEEVERTTRSSLAQWSAVGLEFAAAVGLFFLLGRYLDATWGTQPWLGVTGAGLGIVLGTYVLIQKALRDEAASPTRDPGGGTNDPHHPRT